VLSYAVLAELQQPPSYVHAHQCTLVRDAAEAGITLSQREREVLQCFAAGMTELSAGAWLGITTSTVKTHAKRIMGRLDATTRTHAVALALRHGLLDEGLPPRVLTPPVGKPGRPRASRKYEPIREKT